MAREVELKFTHADLAAVAHRLQALGGAVQSPRAFEQNLVFDTPARALRKRGELLRLRRQGERATLTYKYPPAPDAAAPEPSGMKVLEERETAVADFAATQAILEGLGYAVAFTYEKYRETWRLETASGPVLVCLDHTPFMDVVELEGDAAAIHAGAEALALPTSHASTLDYHALHHAWRVEQGLPPQESFVFGEEGQGAGSART